MVRPPGSIVRRIPVTTAAFHQLRQFDGRPGVSIAAKGAALELKLVRGDVEVRVVVPAEVLEWFVDVEQRPSGSRATDWCDYEGYDNRPVSELDEDMAEEVTAFVSRLIERDLRYVGSKNRPDRGVLEWLIDGQWHQAVPFVVLAT
ncbi:hypothetical protein [Arenimonas sp.]|uniref:hypothetical protein n=1 Tax=Arenimonas sp. TaxID=1872635 RepID=UPI0039E375FC